MAVVDERGADTGPPSREFDRQPPQDVQAEQSVLGGMLLSKDAIADVVEVVRGGDFYRPAHQIIYDVVTDLYGRGEPADPVTVSAELQRSGQLMRIGGTPYLHTLMSSVPTAANAGYYAEIVAECAVLRRLVEAGTRIVQLGYGAVGESRGDIESVVDRAQAAVYDVTERRTSDDYVRLEQLLQGAMDEIDAIATRGGASLGVPTGFAQLDEITNGLQPSQMVTVAARPGAGKSVFALDVARSCSIKHGMTSVIFNLEMSKSEITMRLLAAEARVPMHNMRSGNMTDEHWSRLARRMGEVADAPLYIDDSPNLTMMEIRAKARRLKQRHDLKLVIVDYLQLMTSGKRVESRQVEVSEFSRSLKLLAMELEVPVISVAQLNRGPEQRTDKKPMLSDLRESGCLTAATRVLRADTGAETTLGDLLADGATDVPVWALDEQLRYVPRRMTHVFPSGRKEVFKLRLASGREVEASANHPFLTYDGWRRLDELAVDGRIAVPRSIPAPQCARSWPDAEVVLLAHLIGDGSFVRNQPIRYASVDEDNLAAVAEAARHFGITAVRDDHPAARCTSLRLPAPYRLTHGRRNPVAQWLDRLGLFGLRSHEKFVPAEIFALPRAQLVTFVRHLWATDGSITVNRNGRAGRVYYGSTSRRLIDDLAQLLLRFGIGSRIRTVTPGDHRPQYTLDISGRDDQVRFLREIGAHGARGVVGAKLLDILESVESNTNIDTVPVEVWRDVRELISVQGMTHRQFSAAIGTQFCGSALWKRAPSRARLRRVASALDAVDLDMLATNDVFWDRIVAIEPLGEQDVYDATVEGAHNFVANGIAVHNSIEQDSDMVLLLHREDMYERESPRAGEADIILAKHRNGPTGVITVAFQGHYTRFVDMQQD